MVLNVLCSISEMFLSKAWEVLMTQLLILFFPVGVQTLTMALHILNSLSFFLSNCYEV